MRELGRDIPAKAHFSAAMNLHQLSANMIGGKLWL
jgi:hypothetical protein